MFAARCRVLPPTRLPTRQLHNTPLILYPRGRGNRKNFNQEDEVYDVDNMPEFEEDDATSAAHIIIQQQKQILNYMRLIERDAPELKAFRKPFIPPPDTTPLVVRTISYAGEQHPATRKQVIVVAVSKLPLHSAKAIHKLKLLAGTRWSARPPSDSGVSLHEDEIAGENGYLKVSCEDFPEPAMNLKWGCDVLDNLLQEANDAKDTFTDIPHDQRHLDAKARKHRKGEHVRNRPGRRPTVKDFPKHWLPPEQPSGSMTTQ